MALYRIVENGSSLFHITAHRYADETVRYAASELQKYILLATGTDIPYFSDRCPIRCTPLPICIPCRLRGMPLPVTM